MGITLVDEGVSELVGEGLNMDEEFRLVVAVICGDMEVILGKTPDDDSSSTSVVTTLFTLETFVLSGKELLRNSGHVQASQMFCNVIVWPFSVEHVVSPGAN